MIPTMYNVLYNGNLALEEGKKELSEKNLRAIANLIMDSKNYVLPQMQIINTFIHSVRITTILFVRTLFGNVSLN